MPRQKAGDERQAGFWRRSSDFMSEFFTQETGIPDFILPVRSTLRNPGVCAGGMKLLFGRSPGRDTIQKPEESKKSL